MVNATLGEVDCPICHEVAQLRRCAKGARTWYWVCKCGKITPNLPAGQEWIMVYGRIFGKDKPDDDSTRRPDEKPAPIDNLKQDEQLLPPKPKPDKDPAPVDLGKRDTKDDKKTPGGWLDW